MAKNKLTGAIAINKEWEAKCDADILAQAEQIKADAKRMARAAKAAQKMADEQMVKAQAMKKIARKK